MDPLTIIGLVSSIVQFVDFGFKVVSKTVEIYQSGNMDEEVANIDSATRDFNLILANLTAVPVSSDKALNEICESCKISATKLKKALDKLQVNGKKHVWRSLRTALQTIWDRKEIEELEKQLGMFRSQLNLRITVDLRYVPGYMFSGNYC